ncbi:MAG: ATP-binding protein, partial [Moorea sp. SIO2B7]|nr:ATP-binding protein [Moorena sp. SIO2B7]
SRIRQLLETHIKGEANSAIVSSPIPETTRLGQLISIFGLSPLERDILLLCVGMEIDSSFASLCAKAHGNTQQNYPTISLALTILPESNWRVLSPLSPLQHWQMIEFAPGLTLTQTPIRIDKRILCYLLAERAIDEQLKGFVRFAETESDSLLLPPSQEAIASELIATWSDTKQKLPLLQLCGSDLTSKHQISAHVGKHFGRTLGTISAAVLPTNPNELHQLQQRWERESFLGNYILFLNCDQISLQYPLKNTAISLFVETINTPLIISTQERLQIQERSVVSFDVPSLSYDEQKLIWETHLGTFGTELNGQIVTLASYFNLSSATIKTACTQFKNNQTNITTEVEKSQLPNQLWYFCRSQARPRLEDLGQRIETKATWDDLVLPKQQKSTLREMVIHLRQRGKVYEEWGFAGKERRGLGISALFSGASGTGKTMAAGVLAKELNLDLYRIDLSAVVSKYIGETEKNLRRIFDAAETGSVILLFDEADALFGKRTDVKDSHDRHANVEVSYLLQRMEAYQGLAILTTNMKTSLDSAFLRRIRFSVSFPFPDVPSRTEIWRRIFPAQTPTEELNFQTLGKLSIAGGNIRNIALNSAMLAADEDEPVMMKHIYQATQSEYLKLEKCLTEWRFSN